MKKNQICSWVFHRPLLNRVVTFTQHLIKGLTGPVFLGCREASAGYYLASSAPPSSHMKCVTALPPYNGSYPGPLYWRRGTWVSLSMSTSGGEHRRLQSEAGPRKGSASASTIATTSAWPVQRELQCTRQTGEFTSPREAGTAETLPKAFGLSAPAPPQLPSQVTS